MDVRGVQVCKGQEVVHKVVGATKMQKTRWAATMQQLHGPSKGSIAQVIARCAGSCAEVAQKSCKKTVYQHVSIW